MKKLLVAAAIILASVCSCMKGGKCKCDFENSNPLTGKTTKSDVIIFANEDESCAEAQKRQSIDLGDAGYTKYTNCRSAQE